jgi:allantoinase
LSRKGRIDVGYDADLVVFRPDLEFVVDSTVYGSGSTGIPYAGRRLRGLVERTYLRGEPVYSQESGWTSANCRGKLVGCGAG